MPIVPPAERRKGVKVVSCVRLARRPVPRSRPRMKGDSPMAIMDTCRALRARVRCSGEVASLGTASEGDTSLSSGPPCEPADSDWAFSRSSEVDMACVRACTAAGSAREGADPSSPIFALEAASPRFSAAQADGVRAEEIGERAHVAEQAARAEVSVAGGGERERRRSEGSGRRGELGCQRGSCWPASVRGRSRARAKRMKRRSTPARPSDRGTRAARELIGLPSLSMRVANAQRQALFQLVRLEPERIKAELCRRLGLDLDRVDDLAELPLLPLALGLFVVLGGRGWCGRGDPARQVGRWEVEVELGRGEEERGAAHGVAQGRARAGRRVKGRGEEVPVAEEVESEDVTACEGRTQSQRCTTCRLTKRERRTHAAENARDVEDELRAGSGTVSSARPRAGPDGLSRGRTLNSVLPGTAMAPLTVWSDQLRSWAKRKRSAGSSRGGCVTCVTRYGRRAASCDRGVCEGR